MRTSTQRSGEQIILTSHQLVALRLFVAPSEHVFSSIEEHRGSDEIPSFYVQLDSYGIPNRTFHLLIHIGILPKNVSDSDVTGWNSQMAGQSDKNDAAREEFILEPLPASFSSKSHWKMGAVFAL